MSELRQCPPLPSTLAGEYEKYLDQHPHFTETDDELFDHAFDFLDGHELEPKDAYGEGDLECLREWTYELMDSIGRKYGTNPRPRGILKWVSGLVMTAVGIGGFVAGLRARAVRNKD